MFMFLLTFFSCTKEKTVFETSVWWFGHWQNMDEPSLFFSIGQKPVGVNDIRTTQFFISTSDSIYANFYLISLEDFNYKKKFKIIKTSEGSFIKIQEIDEEHITVYGPSNSIEGLESMMVEYRMIPDSVAPPFSDSILFED